VKLTSVIAARAGLALATNKARMSKITGGTKRTCLERNILNIKPKTKLQTETMKG
jgi:hypothetical protein